MPGTIRPAGASAARPSSRKSRCAGTARLIIELSKRPSRITLSLIAGMLKSFGMVSYKVSVPPVTPAPSKPKKTPKATVRTAGLLRELAKPSHHGTEGPEKCDLCAWYRQHGRLAHERPHGGKYRRPGGKWVVAV